MCMTDDATVPKSGVYRLDLGNDWYYVGSSRDLEKRRRRHRRDLQIGNHSNHTMQNVFNKYGYFAFTVLARYPVGEILEQEQALLDTHCGNRKCLNVATVAASPMAGRKTSDSTRAKQSAAMAGRHFSADHRAALSAAWAKRQPPSPETRAKISAGNKGRKYSAERLAKWTGRKLSTEHRAAMSAAQMARQARIREAASTL